MKRRTLLTMSTLMMAVLGTRVARAQADTRKFLPQELDQILAPIALYSDSLLSQMLMAASYPIEIVEAARWSKANPQTKGEAAVAAVQNQTWDVSVKSLVAFPSALMQLNDHLDWTQKLGDAMISQEQDVADSIQRLRAKAADAGNLTSGPQQTVTTQGGVPTEPSSSSRPIPTSSTCRRTIQIGLMARGRSPPILRSTIRRRRATVMERHWQAACCGG